MHGNPGEYPVAEEAAKRIARRIIGFLSRQAIAPRCGVKAGTILGSNGAPFRGGSAGLDGNTRRQGRSEASDTTASRMGSGTKGDGSAPLTRRSAPAPRSAAGGKSTLW